MATSEKSLATVDSLDMLGVSFFAYGSFQAHITNRSVFLQKEDIPVGECWYGIPWFKHRSRVILMGASMPYMFVVRYEVFTFI